MSKKNIKSTENEISRKEALKKIGNFGKFAALTAIGGAILLNPKKAQATSDPGGAGEDF
ncbi:hypothetical protein [Aureivirga sp. CE67]|uniref:hypothetical protein n=1 Tax=Aureivirga sp. CE67 TaxID=1788983 RepID=UPI0018CBE212|nr:hypothetical protein [Aureivirga sp. CE67]